MDEWHGLACDSNRLQAYVVIIAMRAVLVALLVDRHVLSECFLAFLANKSHFVCFA